MIAKSYHWIIIVDGSTNNEYRVVVEHSPLSSGHLPNDYVLFTYATTNQIPLTEVQSDNVDLVHTTNPTSCY